MPPAAAEWLAQQGHDATHVRDIGLRSAPDEDVWAEALLNFMLFKAYSKDAEFGGNAALSTGYYTLFNAALGVQLQSSSQVAQTTRQGSA